MIKIKPAVIFAASGVLLALGAALILPSLPGGADQGIANGAALYAQNCASCHGANLAGQADWQKQKSDGTYPAPPHDESGHTWHHGDAMLTEYITIGGQAALDKMGVAFKSGMPAFGTTLKPDQIADILLYLKSTWSDRAQTFQASVTETEKLDQP